MNVRITNLRTLPYHRKNFMSRIYFVDINFFTFYPIIFRQWQFTKTQRYYNYVAALLQSAFLRVFFLKLKNSNDNSAVESF